MSNTNEKNHTEDLEAVKEEKEQPEREEKKILRITSLTLIAVTVILAIAAILTGTALHDARAAETKQTRAEDFAESLLDTLQSMGQERVESQFWNGLSFIAPSGSASVYNGMPFSIVDNYDRIGPADRQFRILSGETGVKLPGNGEIQRYAILGTEYQGTTYDVQIQYDPSGYGADSESDSHAYNVNNFPDTGTLTSDTTAIISPEGAYVRFPVNADGSYEYDSIAQQFRSENLTLESSAVDNIYMKRSTFYEEAVAIVNSTINDTEIHNWRKLIGTSFYDSSDKSQKMEELKKYITRNTIILAEGGEGNVKITSSVLFKLTEPSFVGDPEKIISALPGMFASATVIVPKEEEVIAEDGTVTKVETLVEEPVPQERVDELVKALKERIQELYEQATSDEACTEQFMVYESDHPFLKLDNIYLMYYPLRNGQWKSDTISIDISQVNKLYNKDHKLNLYVVPQLGLLSSGKKAAYDNIQASDYIAPKLEGGQISFDHSSRTATIEHQGTLFDLARIRVNYVKGFMRTLAAADMKDTIMKNTDPEDILYTLQVKLYKASQGSFEDRDYILESSVTSS